MHEFGIADGILGGGERLSRSETISCVCMFSLSHTFTKDGRAAEREKKPQLGSQFITSVCKKPVVSKSFSVWSCQNYSSTPPITKAHFMVTGRTRVPPPRTGSIAHSPAQYLSSQREHTPPSRGLALEGMIHDACTLSLIRPATCSSQPLLTGISSV